MTDEDTKEAIYRRVREVVADAYEGNGAAFGRASGISQSVVNRIIRGQQAHDHHSRVMIERLTKALAMNHPVRTNPGARRERPPKLKQFTLQLEPVTHPAQDVAWGEAWVEAQVRPVADTTQALARLGALKERLFEITLEVEEIENSLKTPPQTG
jgi:hypothetical protein